MILTAYKKRETHHLNAADIALFKASDKYVVAVTNDGEEWLLSGYMTLKQLEAGVPGLTRISRSVLVRTTCLVRFFRAGMDKNYASRVETTVGVYPVARRIRIKPLQELAKHNAPAPSQA